MWKYYGSLMYGNPLFTSVCQCVIGKNITREWLAYRTSSFGAMEVWDDVLSCYPK
jgi:hypothetical protein